MKTTQIKAGRFYLLTSGERVRVERTEAGGRVYVWSEGSQEPHQIWAKSVASEDVPDLTNAQEDAEKLHAIKTSTLVYDTTGWSKPARKALARGIKRTMFD